MNFGAFYDANQFGGTKPGMMRGGFWADPPDVETDPGTVAGSPVYFTKNHYDITNTEPRIASYIGIARGQIPPAHYFATNRTFPASCDWSWLEQRPVGVTRTYEGIDVFEGAFTYRGMHIVPTWGGDMFEELMPDLFVPESTWAPKSWGVNHPLAVRAQIEHGLDEAGYGYWGFSPASDPFAEYNVYGVDAIGMSPEGYPSDHEATNVDAGYDGCRPATNPSPTFGDGVVTPHASFLALPYAPREAVDNLRNIETDARRLRGRRVLRLGRGAVEHAGQAVPVARPGHGPGRGRQPARPRRAAPLVRHARRRDGCCARSSARRSSARG